MMGTLVDKGLKKRNFFAEKTLRREFIKQPDSTAEWRNIAKKYEKYWNFPNCVGAINGRHVTIQCPAGGGSTYFNYKKFHNIVLLALVNA